MQTIATNFPQQLVGGVSSRKLTLDDITFVRATKKDASAVADLYKIVYKGDYPVPEMMTAQGMEKFLDYTQSQAITLKFTHQTEMIGAITLQFKGRAGYGRGGVVRPEMQGMISGKACIQKAYLDWEREFAGHIDYYYGEARTEHARMQAILDEMEWRSYALFPRKDIFKGKRESEVLQIKHFAPIQLGPLNLSPQAAWVASLVMNKDIQPGRAKVSRFTRDSQSAQVEYDAPEERLTITRGASRLVAVASLPPRNIEKVAIESGSLTGYHALVGDLMEEATKMGMEYIEIFAPASEIQKQLILESFNFRPTGFVPRWYGPGSDRLDDYVVYTITFPSELEEFPMELVEGAKYLRALHYPCEPSFKEGLGQISRPARDLITNGVKSILSH